MSVQSCFVLSCLVLSFLVLSCLLCSPVKKKPIQDAIDVPSAANDEPSTATDAAANGNQLPKPTLGGFKMLNADQPFANATRSLYIGNLPEDCTIRDICDVVRGDRGLECVRLLPGKACAFIDFCTRLGAERFVQRCRRQRLQIAGCDCRLGWAKERPLAAAVEKAMEAGATRNVYFSFASASGGSGTDAFVSRFETFCRENFDSAVDAHAYFSSDSYEGCGGATEETTSLKDPLVSFLFSLFDPFGPIDMIKVVPRRKIAFIHMAAMGDAMRAVAELSIAPEFAGKRLSFGRDRCGERLENISASSTAATATAAAVYPTGAFNPPLTAAAAATPNQRRTVFLGSVGPEVTIEDICDHIHTGQLQSVRINPDKRCAFVTFLKPESAEIFLARSMQFGLHIRTSQLKPAFAKERAMTESAQLPGAIQAALRKGVTRNLFLGNADFTNVLSESQLRAEMAQFGPLDRIQVLKERGIAFVHFANLLDAARAFERLKTDHNFRNCRIGFGRDRCEPASFSHQPPAMPHPQPHPQQPFFWQNQYYPPPLLYDPASACYYYPTAPPLVMVQEQVDKKQQQQQQQQEDQPTKEEKEPEENNK